ncbi:MAG: hypothetical protein JXC32_22430, partial [Anaerolineae bacterium]|nr:hypothetical protein [Anaerolineae bacterium]
MQPIVDGPMSPRFTALTLDGDTPDVAGILSRLPAAMRDTFDQAPTGPCISWGIPFDVGVPLLLDGEPVEVTLPPTTATWFVVMHTADLAEMPVSKDGLISPMRGGGMLNQHVADYVFVYDDGTEARVQIRRRHQIGSYRRRWGENCFQAVAHRKPSPVNAAHEQLTAGWGQTQTRVFQNDGGPWTNWLWAWENPSPEKPVVGLRLEPIAGCMLVFGLAAGDVSDQPLRWRRRRKALLTLPEGETLDRHLDDRGCLAQIQLDLGQVISALPRPRYPDDTWADSYNNQLPEPSGEEVLVEYTAHPDAAFHLARALPIDDALTEPAQVPVASVEAAPSPAVPLAPIPPATQRVTLRVVEAGTARPVAVKLHVHGPFDEYLAPVDRHRIINPAWFEDY